MRSSLKTFISCTITRALFTCSRRCARETPVSLTYANAIAYSRYGRIMTTPRRSTTPTLSLRSFRHVLFIHLYCVFVCFSCVTIATLCLYRITFVSYGAPLGLLSHAVACARCRCLRPAAASPSSPRALASTARISTHCARAPLASHSAWRQKRMGACGRCWCRADSTIRIRRGFEGRVACSWLLA